MTTQRLERIKVSGYKSIRDADIELRNLNVLIGANGAGKSNFISLFELLNAIIEQRLQAYTEARGADSLLYFGQSVTDEIKLSFEFSGEQPDLTNLYSMRLVPSQIEKLFFGEESYGLWNHSKYPTPFWNSLGSGHRETQLYEESNLNPNRAAVDYVIDAIKDWKVYHFHDTSASARVKQSSNIDDNRFFRPDAGNLAAYLFLLQKEHPDYYRRIVKTIQLIAPFFGNFSLEPLLRSKQESIRLEWREKDSDTYFNAHALSDGTLRFICLTTLLLQPELPSVILIDEPELGLHPYAITLLASLLRSAAAKTQVIVSTQSVPLINQLDPEDILVVEREDAQSVFKRLDTASLESWLSEYGLGDLWEKNVIGGRPRL